MTLDHASCYHALVSRDRRFDGRFFTGVITTGIYCRPVCPSPPPHLKHVRFFACAAAAETEGFRPCRRCHPEAAPGTPAWIGASAVVSRALRLIADYALDDASVEALASRLGIGGRQLRRLFAQHLGASPIEVARARRVHFARTLLDDTALPITQIAFAAGFRSLRQFNHSMHETFGRAPRDLRSPSFDKLRTNGKKSRGGDIEFVRGEPVEPRMSDLVVRLPYRPPLAWSTLLGFLEARAIPGVEIVQGGSYCRTVEINGTPGCVEIRHDSSKHLLVMRVDLPVSAGLLALAERARRLFDLNADPLAIAVQLRGASSLVPGLRAGIRVPGAWDPFELALRAVLGQQISVKGATTLSGRIAERFGRPLERAKRWGLSRLSPRAVDLVDADLEPVGLPRARAKTIRVLARAVVDGTLRLDASQGLDDAVERLCQVPGVGPWTAHYIAMRACGEPDAFPSGDLGLRRALGTGVGPLSQAELERRADVWRPWRAYAAMCLWTAGTGGRQPPVRLQN